jgi:hypothetical protein
MKFYSLWPIQPYDELYPISLNFFSFDLVKFSILNTQ